MRIVRFLFSLPSGNDKQVFFSFPGDSAGRFFSLSSFGIFTTVPLLEAMPDSRCVFFFQSVQTTVSGRPFPFSFLSYPPPPLKWPMGGAKVGKLPSPHIVAVHSPASRVFTSFFFTPLAIGNPVVRACQLRMFKREHFLPPQSCPF